MTSTSTLVKFSPSFMSEPLPNCFSICSRAASRARAFSSCTADFFSGAGASFFAIPAQPRFLFILHYARNALPIASRFR